MSKSFNPGRLDGALKKGHYASGLGLAKVLKHEREAFVRLVRQKHQDNLAAQALADKLESCKKGRRCKSAACPECARAAQMLFASTVGASVEDLAAGKQIVCVSVVPADGICKPTELAAAHTLRNVRRWKEGLGRAGITWFVGGLDYSFNEHDADRYEPHWSEHLYGLATTTDIEALKKKLRERFLSNDDIPRPVHVQPWDGRTGALNYLLKPNAWRRVATDEGERFDKKGDGKRECRSTDKQRLRSSERVQLALHLDEIGLQGRLVMRWAQFVNYGSSTEIVDRKPEPVGPKMLKTADRSVVVPFCAPNKVFPTRK